MQKFNSVSKHGEGVNGVVKIINVRNKVGKEISLAFKKLDLNVEDMNMLEDEIKY